MKNKSERLYEILGQVDDDIVERTDPEKVGKTKKSSNLKWLSIAACFVLVTVIGVVAWKAGLPESSPIVDDNTVETDLKTPEFTDDQSNEKTTDPQDTTTSDTIETPFPEQAGSESDDVTSETNDSNTADTTENTYSANGGTSGMCKVHSDIYHSFPHTLMEYVGLDEAYNWIEKGEEASKGYDDRGCPWKGSIYEFIHEFNIPKDVFVKWYNETDRYYSDDYDIDLLYNGTAEENDAYYRDYSERENTVMAKRGAFDQVKGYIFTTRMSELMKVLGENLSSAKVSLAEMVYILDMPREELESIIAQSKELVPYLLRYDYDLDLIYDQREYVEGLIEEHSAFYVDLLFCGEEPREQAYPEK